VNTVAPAPSIEAIESRISPLREQLAAHPLYSAIRTLEDFRLFMQSHVFAVWDFMSLLKSLQRTLTCVDLPWTPSAFPASRRFINEIVLGEESDEYRGRPISHFEIYLEAMQQAGADTQPIRSVLTHATQNPPTFDLAAIPAPAQAFVESTFHFIRHRSAAAQAAAFAFGREDAIPAMFRALVRNLNRELDGTLDQFVWYLERHIEVDGDDHGPLALNVVADLCANDEALWEDAANAAEESLRARIRLWDGIFSLIESPRH
jgi:Protein of unknown function (DUF3050)